MMVDCSIFNPFLLLLFLQFLIGQLNACTNFIVSSDASADNSTMAVYNADSGTLYGSIYLYPDADHVVGTTRSVYDWDTGVYLGDIEEASHTYNVVGNMNEFGLAITETTFGGVDFGVQTQAKIDYGSLIYITLSRAKTARDAISTISELMGTYGYASSGESFSISDGKEAWVMEIVSKGSIELGAVYVAQKLPQGSICAHANQARIRTFPKSDPDNCIYSPDVISFARNQGLYRDEQTDSDFSFSDVYDPVTFSGARFCEARVWALFRQVMGSKWGDQYEDYATGKNLTNRMPLFVFPTKKLSQLDVFALMRNHYEGTVLDMSGVEFADIGAANAQIPYRVHPLTWPSNGQTYLNERPVSTPQSAWSILCQTRNPDQYPEVLRGLLWFGMDDSATTVHLPVYTSSKRVSPAYAGKGPQDGVITPMMNFDPKVAFHAFNLVANWAYSRWSVIYPDVLAQINAAESAFVGEVEKVDSGAFELLARGDESIESVREYLTLYSVRAGDQLVSDWNAFFGQLFVKNRDGYTVVTDPTQLTCNCNAEPEPYPQGWYDQIVASTSDHYLYPTETVSQSKDEGDKVKQSNHRVMDKLELLKKS